MNFNKNFGLTHKKKFFFMGYLIYLIGMLVKLKRSLLKKNFVG